MAKYKCVNKCYFRDRVWGVGEFLDSRKGEKIPHHFEQADEVESDVDEDGEPETMSELNAAQADVDAATGLPDGAVLPDGAESDILG